MESDEKLARSIKSLSAAVWVLCALIFCQLAFAAWGQFQMRTLRSQTYESRTTHPADDRIDDNDFPALKPEQKFKRATAILNHSVQEERRCMAIDHH
jgi:hypothetical protein